MVDTVNLSSDAEVLRKIVELRRRAEKFAWKIRVWFWRCPSKKKETESTPAL
jgi:hypothetical protein